MERDGARYVAYDEIQRWNDDTSNTTGVDDVERTDLKQLEEAMVGRDEAATTDGLSTAMM